MLRYKHPTSEDLPKLNEWVAADAAHKDQFRGDHFVLLPDDEGRVTPGIQCIEVLDDVGTVFYLKFTNALIVEAQFPPDSDEKNIRIASALKEAFGYFSFAMKKSSYHAMFFNSVSDSLIKFFEKHGFKKLTDYFKADL